VTEPAVELMSQRATGGQLDKMPKELKELSNENYVVVSLDVTGDESTSRSHRAYGVMAFATVAEECGISRS